MTITSLTDPALATRTDEVRQVLRWFTYDHLPADLYLVSKRFADVALVTVSSLPDDPELEVALRKLLEAKDAAVRVAVAYRDFGPCGADSPHDPHPFGTTGRCPGVTLDLPLERCPVRGSHPGHDWHSGHLSGGLFQLPPPNVSLVRCDGHAI